MLLQRSHPLSNRLSHRATICRHAGTLVLALVASLAWTSTTALPALAQSSTPVATAPPQATPKVQIAVSFKFADNHELGSLLTKLAQHELQIAGLTLSPPTTDQPRVAAVRLNAKHPDRGLVALAQIFDPASLLSTGVVQAPVPSKPIPPVGGSGELHRIDAPRVRFAFKNADVLKVVDTIAKISGSNIVLPPSLSGQVSIRLQNVPALLALEFTVQQLGHTVIADGGILRVIAAPPKPKR